MFLHITTITSLVTNWCLCGGEAIIRQMWVYLLLGLRVSNWKRIQITSSFWAAHRDFYLQHTETCCAVSARIETTWQLHLLSWCTCQTEKPVMLTWYLCSVLVHAVVFVTQMNVVHFQRWRSQPFHCYRTGFQLLQRQFVIVCVSKLL